MRDRDEPQIKISDLDKWLHAMVISGQLIFKSELFTQKGLLHRFTFTFPKRTVKDTSEEDELDDLKTYFKQAKATVVNRLDKTEGHIISCTLKTDQSNAKLIDLMNKIREVSSSYSSYQYKLDHISQAEWINDENAIESIADFKHTCDAINKLIKNHGRSEKLLPRHELFKKMILYHANIQERLQHHPNASTLLSPINQLIQDQYQLCQEDIVNRRDKLHQLYMDSVIFLLPYFMHLNSRHEQPSEAASTAALDEKYRDLRRSLSRLYNVCHYLNDRQIETISISLIDHMINSMKKTATALEKNTNRSREIFQPILDIVDQYASELDLHDLYDQLFRPIRSRLVIDLFNEMMVSLSKNTPIPIEALQFKLDRYQHMTDVLIQLFRKVENTAIHNHLLNEYIRLQNVSTNGLSEPVFIADNTPQIIDHLLLVAKPTATFDLNEHVMKRFIAEQFNRLTLPIKDIERFKHEVNQAFQPLLLLGRINYLIQRGINDFQNSNARQPLNNLSQSLAHTLTMIASDITLPINEHIKVFTEEYLNHPITVSSQGRQLTVFKEDSTTLLFARLDKLIKHTDSLVTDYRHHGKSLL